MNPRAGIIFLGEFLSGAADTVGTFLAQVSGMAKLLGTIVRRTPLALKNVGISIEQMFGLGIESLPLVAVIAIFTGATTVTQAVYQFSGLIPYKYLGTAVCKTLITEIGPVFTSMVVAGRIATGIAAEIGSMKVNEQLDAMDCLNLDPIRYLFVPKTIACALMLPVLVIFAECIAILSSIVTVIFSVNVTLYVYLNGLKSFFHSGDLFVGIAKTAVFGIIISLTGCYFGLQAKDGAEGVGTATTRAVMASCILILVFDFIIALVTL
jgi:phospholipid/cholesterol/gamma-HCH transport system permease protein